MTDVQKILVQKTFKMAEPSSEAVAAMFYERLFSIDPTAAALFKGDMKEQGRRLMNMISGAVKGLDYLEDLLPLVEDLGRRHRNYRVTAEHYETVGAALLWTLEKFLGAEFTFEVRDAWTEVYGVLAATMQRGASCLVA